jgi:hypothetical protein
VDNPIADAEDLDQLAKIDETNWAEEIKAYLLYG